MKLLFLLLFATTIFATHAQNTAPVAKKGVLDLREWDFEGFDLVGLKGEWEFFWKQIVTDASTTPSSVYFNVPSRWNDFELNGASIGGHGVASHRLKVLIPKHLIGKSFAIKTAYISSAYELYADGKLLTKVGVVGKNQESTTPKARIEVVEITPTNDTIILNLVLANFHNFRGGFWDVFQFGLEPRVRAERESSVTLQSFLIGSILIMAFYHFALFLLRPGAWQTFYFALICLIAVVRILVTVEYQINQIVDLAWQIVLKLEYSSFYAGFFVFGLYFSKLFPDESIKQAEKFHIVFCGLFILPTLILSANIYTQPLFIFQIYALVFILYVLFILIKAIRNKRKSSYIFLVGITIFSLSVINDILYHNQVLATGDYFSYGLFFLIFSQSFLIAFSFSDAYQQTQQLSQKLHEANNSLEEKVEQRTTELKESNEELLQLNEEILLQSESLNQANGEIRRKNKSITDSINYAQRIQKALLENWSEVKNYYPEAFVLFKPRDVVSGDFYWFKHSEDKSIFAAVDCTGHGVPGAFMSIIAYSLLREITERIDEKAWNASMILNELDTGVRSMLKSDQTRQNDGMDMSLCIIDHQEQTLAFSGAKSPMVYFQEGEMTVVKGDKHPIGGHVKNKSFKGFTLHKVNANQPTTFYLFSDGFADQFGGKENRKFMAKRFRTLLKEIHQLPMDEQKERLSSAYQAWKKGASQIDDVLVLGVKVSF